MSYKTNSTHIFIARGIKDGPDDKKYLELSRAGHNDKITDYVLAFDYQTEWVEQFPCKVWCEVQEYRSDLDMYVLQQCYLDVLKDRYKGLPKLCEFKVLNSKSDAKTKQHFYILKDAYGLCHRFYSQKGTLVLGEEVKMTVAKIVERANHHAYLDIVMPQNMQDHSSVSSVAMPINTSEDPRSESKFGMENDVKEFKASIVYTPSDTTPQIDEQMKTILKTIAGFMNKNGGTLYLGVNDAGKICGIEGDYEHLNSSSVDSFTYRTIGTPKQLEDQYELKIRNAINRHLTSIALGNNVVFDFHTENNRTYCIVKISKAKYPVFYNGIKLFQRMGNQTNLLSDFEICLFVQERMSNFKIEEIKGVDVKDTTDGEYTAPERTNDAKSCEDIEEEKAAEKAVKIEINRPVLTPWRYVRLYAGGEWSYGKKPTMDTVGLVREITLPKEKNGKKDNRLMIVYKNGCAASVLIGNIKPAKEDHKYSNGWKGEEEILDAFVVGDHDLIAYRSETADGEQWNKMHYSGDVSDQEKMGGKGNTVVNARLKGKITDVTIVPSDCVSRLGAYILKSNQTSTSLGFKRSDPSFRDSLRLLDAVFEK